MKKSELLNGLFDHFHDDHEPDMRAWLARVEKQQVRPKPIEMEEDDLPERAYTKNELQAYLNYGRRKCQATIEALTDETAQRRCQFAWGEVSFVELQLYSMRHVQEHASQLSLMLGQKVGSAPDWARPGIEPPDPAACLTMGPSC